MTSIFYYVQSSQVRQKRLYLKSNHVTISYFTTLYGSRFDSQSKLFSNHLQPVCRIIDPEDFREADVVFTSAVDLVELPASSEDGRSYRRTHGPQLWLFYSEESPRNSYHSIKSKTLLDLDDWFNLTATLNQDSDFPIQYRAYRVKPSIGKLIENKLDVKLNENQLTLLPVNIPESENSSDLSILSSIVRSEYITRRQYLIDNCPYSCNKPLPSKLIEVIQDDLPKFEHRPVDRQIVNIAWFVSNCNTHSRREDYVRQLRAQPGIRVDIYGDCSSVFDRPIVRETCRKGTPNCIQKILSRYRFYLSFENSKCNGYITEKYWIQGLSGYAVPIVLGAKKIQYETIAIPNSFLHVDDFNSVEDLAKELHRLNTNDHEYNKYLQWTQLYDVSENFTFRTTKELPNSLCLLGYYQRLQKYDKTMNTKQVQSIQEMIRSIFYLSKIPVTNMNWTTGDTRRINISQFHAADKQCWDTSYPSAFQRIYNHLFSWLW